VDAPVGHGALAHPRVEHRADRLAQLLAGVLREVLAGSLPVERLEVGHERAQVVHRQVGVELHARGALSLRDRGLDPLARHPAADVAEHLHEAPVRVPREALVAGYAREALHAAVVQPEVEDRVHHPRHRLARAGADRHEQRVLRVAQPLAGVLLEPRESAVHLLLEVLGLAPVGVHVRDARLGGDREAGRHAVGAEHARHLRDVGSLAAEQIAHLARPLGEVVHELRALRHPRAESS
jgi:hypothetical protein